MTTAAAAPEASVPARSRGNVLDYLCVDAFLGDMIGARALSSAFETGVIDHIFRKSACSVQSLRGELGLDERGLDTLLSMLFAHGVLESAVVADGVGLIRLTPAFGRAMAFRDLLEAKLYFAHLVAPDYLQLLTALLFEPAKFVEHARIFKLFSYHRALEPTEQNYEATARWMRLTTALTRHEAAACIAAVDFSAYRRVLDVGGNSGEFVLHLCRAHNALRGTVYDLPLVCDIGEKHLSAEAEAPRIGFIRHDPARPELPGDHDLIVFKSMLHDWPDAEMRDFLHRAWAALPPGGTLIIFERAQVKVESLRVTYGQLPLMLFFRSYRAPETYRKALQAAGFQSVSVGELLLDMPFALITAVK
jgi:SAM-dependent methyltransferase